MNTKNSNNNKSENRKLFYLVLILMPFLILVVFEYILRLSGFGYSYPLFVESKTFKSYMQPNPEVIKRYFPNSDQAPSIEPDTYYFKREKSVNSFRIVIQGGSTAAGFPFGRFGSIAGMLQQRFKRLYPEREIEIVSTAMSAVNSYTLLDFTDEIIDIQPDLVLIYAGHNEFLGVMGVGSAFAAKASRSTTLVFLKLKELRIFQLIQRIYASFHANDSEIKANDSFPNFTNNSNDKRTLMAKIAANKNIAFQSELYQQGLEQFSKNLDLILGKYKSADIPVMLSTLVSNEKDQAPFVSAPGDNSASSLFIGAKRLFEQKKYTQAKVQFQQARDNDLLRFRAPTVFNRIIRDKTRAANVFLADIEARIRSDVENQVIGFEHIYEHLHPNVRGYFLLAETFVDEIVTEKLISDSFSSYSTESAWQDIPLTQVDIIAANFKIKTLMSDYPFQTSKQPVEFGELNSFDRKLAKRKLEGEDWLRIQQQMLQHYQKNHRLPEAAKVAGIISDAFPNQAQAAQIAGHLYFAIGDITMASFYHQKAVVLSPENIDYLLSSARSFYTNKQLRKSLMQLQKVLRLDPHHSQAQHQYEKISTELNK